MFVFFKFLALNGFFTENPGQYLLEMDIFHWPGVVSFGTVVFLCVSRLLGVQEAEVLKQEQEWWEEGEREG